MNRHDAPSDLSREEVYRLAVAVIENDISQAEAQHFERLIANNPIARGWYVDLICDACSIRRLNRGQAGCTTPSTEGDGAQAPQSVRSTSGLSFLGDSRHTGFGYVAQGWPLAYLVAVVILGIGAVIGSLMSVTQPTPTGSNVAGTNGSVAGPKAEFVGRITSMIDCEWADPSTAVRGVAAVPMGRTYTLASGLMEITYDSGAQVILQGPCSYQVDAPAGGYLSVGKLTARVESGESRVQSTNEQSPNPKSKILDQQSPNPSQLSTLNSQLFAVRTPTATVTDLGTEFGVEVTQEGTVETTVFSGKVSVLASAKHGSSAEPQILTIGETARVLAGDETVRVLRGPNDAERFVRSVRTTQSEVLISPTICNGSFEEPAVGPNNFDSDAGNLSIGVYAKIHDVIPAYWDPTSSLQTKGTFARGVTGEQYVVLQAPSPVLSTRFDGAPGHPAVRNYEPHTVYVLTADIGSNLAGMEAIVCLEDGKHRLRRAVAIDEVNTLQSMPPMELDTDRNREFVGRPIGITFTKRNGGDQLYIDNVTLKAVRRSADVPRSGTP